MMDPEQLHEFAYKIILHAWTATYLAESPETAQPAPFATQLATQANRLRESAIALQAALEKMRLANEKLALRMAEHKAFFAKYQARE